MTPSARLPSIVALLADDPWGTSRESASLPACLQARDEIAPNPVCQRIAAKDAGRSVATCRQHIPPGVPDNAGRRALIGAALAASDLRSTGIGARLLAACEIRAQPARCPCLPPTPWLQSVSHRHQEIPTRHLALLLLPSILGG